MSWGPLRLRTASHGVVFEGEASPAPGGGSMTVYGAYSGSAPVSIADGNSDFVIWDTLQSGTELFDHSNPQQPTALASGVYAISGYVTVQNGPLTAAGCALVQLNGPVGDTQTLIPGGISSSQFEMVASFSMTAELDAGDSISVYVFNSDGAASRDFRVGELYALKQ